jgi:predicted RNA-binding protein with PIN domain
MDRPETRMSQKIIIDGYNVIYTDDHLRRIACRDIERARRVFLDSIVSYAKSKRIQITVVFDGRGALADGEVIVPGKLQVVYSARGETADDLIIATLKRSRTPQAYLVVTSDRTHIVPVARGFGCQVLGSRRFLERLRPDKTISRGDEGEKPDPGGEDTDFWLEEFGEPNR